MKTALKLLLSYMMASFLMTALSVALHPSHAHVPAVAVLLAFPLVPWLMLRELLAGETGWKDALPLGVFILAFGGTAWLAFRARSKKGRRAGGA
jgi:hypothetical protein